MTRIYIKVMTEDALAYLKKNLEHITKRIQENDNNEWIYNDFPQPMFIEKKFEVEDFDLVDNPGSSDKEIDYRNSIIIYERLKSLPNYILSSQNFWLWLHFEKFYLIAKNMMKVKSASTIKDHWIHGGGTRRGLFFGVLSRCYYRVALSIDENNEEDIYHLTKWIIENPLRFRNLTWRVFSSQKHLVRGILKGEKQAVEEMGFENNDYYESIAKSVCLIGSVRLLDVISESDIQNMVYQEMMKLMN